MRLSTRLAIAMVSLVLATAFAIGVLSYRKIEAAVRGFALERVESHARLLAAELEGYVRSASADAVSVAYAPAIVNIVNGRDIDTGIPLDPVKDADWRRLAAGRYEADLASKPGRVQYRAIGIANAGREIIRVDRSGPHNSTRIASVEELRSVLDKSYFRDTLVLSPRGIYIAPADIDADLESQNASVFHVATPVHKVDGTPFGIVVIDVDLAQSFAQARATLRSGDEIYVVNEQGDVLVHPQMPGESDSPLEERGRLTDVFPGLLTVRDSGESRSWIAEDTRGRGFGVAVVPVKLANGVQLTVIETSPRERIMEPVVAFANATALSGLIAILMAIVLALLLARSLARPLLRMIGAVEAFGRGQSAPLPVGASGELGVLARAFERMRAEVRDKSEALKYEAEERERVLEALRHSLARQNAVFASALDGILTLNESGSVESLNPAAEVLFGYASDAIMRRDVGHLIDLGGDPAISSTARLRQIVAAKGIQELTGRCSDGSVIPIEVVATDLPVDQRKLFAVFVRDLRAKHFAEEKFRLAFETCPSGMVMVDAAGTILLTNAEAERLFGYGRGELIGQPVEILMAHRFRKEHLQHRLAFSTHAVPRPMGMGRDLLGIRKNGVEFPVEVGLNPIQTQDGPIVLSVILDISERQRNERMKDEFVATVSHELRTPLTSIAGSLGLLSGGAGGTLPDAAMRLIQIAHGNSQRLVRLINDILDIEKIESGKLDFNFKRTDVKPLVEQAIDGNRPFADSFNISVRLDSGSADAVVNVDTDRLTQVVTNLLSNAIKFSPPGGEVVVSIERRERDVRIAVRDHGEGIPDDFRLRIFEKFAQADGSDARRKGGTGLGLSIVKQIMIRLHGDVGFHPAPGGGSIFHVGLPLWDRVDWPEPDAKIDEQLILLCEDDPDVAIVMCDRLRRAGFRPDVACSAKEAVVRARNSPFAAILIDLSLPGRDGISLVEDLRSQSQYENTPIVVISADPKGGHDDERSSGLHALDWLDKPVNMDTLLSILGQTGAAVSLPRILHVDDDPDVLRAVAERLGAIADVVSVTSLEQARSALKEQDFNLAVLDIALSDGIGLDLLPDLFRTNREPIPVVVFSGQDNPEAAVRALAVLTKSRGSLDNLVVTLRRLVVDLPAPSKSFGEVA